MCGFTGYLGIATPAVDAQEILRRMTDKIIHRGPDSAGYWIDLDREIALGHRRLSIVDLSPAGAQPMSSANGRYVLAFNGEIYNHHEIRRKLDSAGAISWRGHSDTETLLAGFEAWGIEKTIIASVGMFSLAIWDKHLNTLTLARDRLGEKPLYYGWQGTGKAAVFLFGSELKALRAHPSFNSHIDSNSLALYMRHMAISGTNSIYTGIYKLAPGTVLTVSMHNRTPEIRTYWSAVEVAQQGASNRFQGSAESATDELEALLKDAIRQQMVADVPLGAFLSGGIDSSTIVALMQAQSTRPVKTFSIGFHEQGYNEAQHAKAVASYLHTDHTELYITPEQALSVVPNLPALYDEPFADSSQIPTHLVSQLARQHVTVSLSGDGGDELFCGYNRYVGANRLWSILERLPMPVRSISSKLVEELPTQALNKLGSLFPARTKWSRLGDRLRKGGDLLGSISLQDLYRTMVSTWSMPESLVLGATEPETELTRPQPLLAELSPHELLMALDLVSYLPDDILTKVDRAAMAVSLETRVPLLDHRVVEFAWRLPLNYKLQQEKNQITQKWILRQVLYRHVPRAIIDRPKMGFGVPIDSWLRGPLKSWADDLLDDDEIKRDGLLNSGLIRQKWTEHQEGHRNWQHALWCVLMFQQWKRSQAQ